MSCGRKTGRKLWDQPKKLPTVTASKYEQQVDHRAIAYWKNVISELEALHFSDDKFWEQNGDQVHGLVGDMVFDRLRKIFNLPKKPVEFEMMDDVSTLLSSAECYKDRGSSVANKRIRDSYSMSDLSPAAEETESLEDESWSSTTDPGEEINERPQSIKLSRSTLKSIKTNQSKSSNLFGRTEGRTASFTTDKQSAKSLSSKTRSLKSSPSHSYSDSAKSGDDLFVHAGDFKRNSRLCSSDNPYYEMFYCNESETDMIKWDSNYKTRKPQTVAVDEASVKAELITKKLAKDFFDWWITIGSVNYKSEIRKPQDIEALFQLWFNEHQSRGLIVDQKIIPCVLKSIAHYINATECSCEKMLQKYVKWDIASEAIPYKTVAFGMGLPTKMKQIPPKNNTDKIWNCLKIPEDLKTMACVWEDIQHLTSTKSFNEWLMLHPTHAVPPVLQTEGLITTESSRQELLQLPPKGRKHIAISSDLSMLQEASSEFALSIPFSQVNIELKDVLSKLMDQ